MTNDLGAKIAEYELARETVAELEAKIEQLKTARERVSTLAAEIGGILQLPAPTVAPVPPPVVTIGELAAGPVRKGRARKPAPKPEPTDGRNGHGTARVKRRWKVVPPRVRSKVIQALRGGSNYAQAARAAKISSGSVSKIAAQENLHLATAK